MLKVITWILSSVIGSAVSTLFLLWLGGYANYIENSYYEQIGINIAYFLFMPAIPAIYGSKLAADFGPRNVKTKEKWFSTINAITTTVILVLIQVYVGLLITAIVYLISAWLCTYIIFENASEMEKKA
ncbi:MAG: hypothetical protein ACE37D_11585 [Pseudomonadales bacterium]